MEERKFFKHILKNRFFQMAFFFNIAEGIIRIALSIKGGNIVDCVRLNAGDEAKSACPRQKNINFIKVL